jgi:beta-lactamase regulating signal transducer with metallopeptidase domain
MGYTLRLIFLSFASFFLLHLVLGAAVLRISGFAVRRTASMRPRQTAWLLFLLRLLPAALSFGIVLLLCVPSYLRYEQKESREPVGYLCMTLAFLGLSLWVLAAVRALRALFDTWMFTRSCHTPVHLAGLDESKGHAFFIEDRLGNGPALALVGICRPKLLLSHQVVAALTPEQLEVALLHESAHRRAWDNLKWLLLSLTPDLFPFVRSLRRLDAHITQATELAADDDAVAGHKHRSVALAEAILQVARLSCRTATIPLASLLTAADKDLAFRIERLLSPSRSRASFLPQPLLTSLCFAALLALPMLFGALHSVHEALELLLR